MTDSLDFNHSTILYIIKPNNILRGRQLVETYLLETIEHAVLIAKTLRQSWFRGHDKIYNELTPTVFRKEYRDSKVPYGPNIEAFFIDSFKRRAPVLESKLPSWDENIDWLLLMQHHGTPTRLLDWTQSAIIALYFVVRESISDDGVMWAMVPEMLNEYSDLSDVPSQAHLIVRYLAEEPFCITEDDKKGLLSNLLRRCRGFDDPVAFRPSMNFPRMISQLSAFTIHPKPITGHTVPELLSDKEHLVRYIIPHKRKFELLQDLAALGFTRRTLYQDLDSLSFDLKIEAKVEMNSPPIPPICGGEWMP